MIRIKDPGTIGELKVSSYFAALGYSIYINVGGKGRSDIVVVKDDISYRVQVKSTRLMRHGSWKVNLRTNRSKKKSWDPSCCDVLAIYIEPEDRVELFDPNKVKNSLTIKKRKV